MNAPAETVEQFLAALPPARREAADALLATVRAHLPAGFEERMYYGMVTWALPLPGQSGPGGGMLSLVSVADHGRYMALYLNCVEPGGEEAFYARWRATGTPLETGARAVRFRDRGELALEVVAEFVAAASAERLLAAYERAVGSRA
jgi:hypothetical protein